METVLVNRPPIGRHTFSSDLICQRMPPVPKFPGLAARDRELLPCPSRHGQGHGGHSRSGDRGCRLTETDILEAGDGNDDNRENCSDKLSSNL